MNHEDFERFLNLVDPNTYLEVVIRRGEQVSLLGRMTSNLMLPGNTVEQDLEEGRKAIDFLKQLIEKFEEELTVDHVTQVRDLFGDQE